MTNDVPDEVQKELDDMTHTPLDCLMSAYTAIRKEWEAADGDKKRALWDVGVKLKTVANLYRKISED